MLYMKKHSASFLTKGFLLPSFNYTKPSSVDANEECVIIRKSLFVYLFTSVSSLDGFTLQFYTVTVSRGILWIPLFTDVVCIFPLTCLRCRAVFSHPNGKWCIAATVLMNLYILAPPSGCSMRYMRESVWAPASLACNALNNFYMLLLNNCKLLDVEVFR